LSSEQFKHALNNSRLQPTEEKMSISLAFKDGAAVTSDSYSNPFQKV